MANFQKTFNISKQLGGRLGATGNITACTSTGALLIQIKEVKTRTGFETNKTHDPQGTCILSLGVGHCPRSAGDGGSTTFCITAWQLAPRIYMLNIKVKAVAVLCTRSMRPGDDFMQNEMNGKGNTYIEYKLLYLRQ